MKILPLCFVTLLLASCSAAPVKTDTSQAPGYQKPITIDDRIAQSAESVSASIKELALIEAANSPKQKASTNQAPAGLDVRLNVTWSGPIQEFLLKSATLSTGYSLKVRGKEPSIPVIVTINSKNSSLYDVIRDAALQAGARANVTVDISNPDDKLIILEYPA